MTNIPEGTVAMCGPSGQSFANLQIEQFQSAKRVRRTFAFFEPLHALKMIIFTKTGSGQT
jgi:hypothetical protein